MDLLTFYLKQIFLEYSLPSTSKICSGAESIENICTYSINFVLIFSIVTILVSIFIAIKNKKHLLSFLGFCLISILTCFFFVDKALQTIQSPAQHGVEWFSVIYYLWAFILVECLFLGLLFNKKSFKFYLLLLVITLLITPALGYFGRGNFVQLTPLIGGLAAKISWDMAKLSFTLYLLSLVFFACLLRLFYELVKNWVIDGKFYLRNKKSKFLRPILFSIIVLIPIGSIYFGEKFNEVDVFKAKRYINEIKKKVDKYYYENGEFPKIVNNFLPDYSPTLLNRHEYFTYGVRGTYYFSRADKYCFIFQNPTRNFGYYSLTNTRDWRFKEETSSLESSYLSLCDESMSSYESLISNNLGIEADDELVNIINTEAGIVPIDNMSKESGAILEQRLDSLKEKSPYLFEDPSK